MENQVSMTINFDERFKGRKSSNWHIKEGSYFRNQILIRTHRHYPLDSWNFDGIISFNFMLENLTKCKNLGIIFWSNWSILRSKMFTAPADEIYDSILLIGRTLIYNLKLRFKSANPWLKFSLGRYFGWFPIILKLLLRNVFTALGVMAFIQFGTFLLG